MKLPRLSPIATINQALREILTKPHRFVRPRTRNKCAWLPKLGVAGLPDDATVLEQAWTDDDLAVAGFLKDDQLIVALTNSKNQKSSTLGFVDDNRTVDAPYIAMSGANYRQSRPRMQPFPSR